MRNLLSERERNAPEESIELLHLISDPLLMELHYEIYASQLRVHPFMRCLDELNPISIRKVCHEGVNSINVTRDDVIFTTLDKPSKVLFIVQGSLSFIHGNHHTSDETGRKECVGQKNWVSEPVLWTRDWEHVGTLQAKNDCRLVVVDAESFQTHVSKYSPHQAKRYATWFVNELNEPESILYTDIGSHHTDLSEPFELIFQEDWVQLRGNYILAAPKEGKAHETSNHDRVSALRKSRQSQTSIIAVDRPSTRVRPFSEQERDASIVPVAASPTRLRESTPSKPAGERSSESVLYRAGVPPSPPKQKMSVLNRGSSVGGLRGQSSQW